MAVRSENEHQGSMRRSGLEAELRVEAERLRTRLQPVVEQHHLYLEAVDIKQAGAHRTVNVIVDLPENASGSVGLDVISAISGDLSAVMDEDPDNDDRPYSLEISSPGVSRPLTEPRHWRRNVGRLVEVKTVSGDVVVGRLQDVTGSGVRILPQMPVKKGTKPRQGDPLTLDFHRISRGIVQVEFARAHDDAAHDKHDEAAHDEPGAGSPARSGETHHGQGDRHGH